MAALNQIARKIGMALLGIFRSAKNTAGHDQRKAAEEERLDRIRNPHNYGPGKL